MRAHVYSCIYVVACEQVWVCMWRSEVDPGCPTQSLSILCTEREHLPWTQSSLIPLVQLACFVELLSLSPGHWVYKLAWSVFMWILGIWNPGFLHCLQPHTHVGNSTYLPRRLQSCQFPSSSHAELPATPSNCLWLLPAFQCPYILLYACWKFEHFYLYHDSLMKASLCSSVGRAFTGE